MFSRLIICLTFLAQPAPAEEVDWRISYEAGQQAVKNRDLTEAAARLEESLEAARAATVAVPGMIKMAHLLAAVRRMRGEYAEAEKLLVLLTDNLPESPNGVDMASLLSELSTVQLAQGHLPEALATIKRAIAIREADGKSSDLLAQDLSSAAMLQLKLGEDQPAVDALQRGLDAWDALQPGDPRSLTVLEALAGIHRNASRYEIALPLYERALIIREAAAGPSGAELISTVDSLAYVYFGMKRYPDAESLYKRLLSLWETNATPEHPMVALTLDKMAEFYAAQERFQEAEVFVLRALEIRANMHVASLHQTGRIHLMEAKLTEAEELYGRAVKIGELSKTTDEVMDPVLRLYAAVLRSLKRGPEADALEQRVKAALLRKADREGRRPSPVK